MPATMDEWLNAWVNATTNPRLENALRRQFRCYNPIHMQSTCLHVRRARLISIVDSIPLETNVTWLRVFVS